MTNKSTKRRNAVVAAIAGAALLLGGSTYALWSAQDSAQGGVIQSGNLAITAGKITSWDVSADRTDTDSLEIAASTEEGVSFPEIQFDATAPKGHGINLATWRMVPKDVVAIAFPYNITLVGDNLVAKLTMSEGDASYSENATVTYQVFQVLEDGTTKALLSDLADFSPSSKPLILFQANSVGQSADDDTDIPVVGTDDSVTVVVMLYVQFNDVGARIDAENENFANFANGITATLDQVRCSAVENEWYDNVCGAVEDGQ